jgi:Outer membrane protein beta-barrel domain
MRRHFIPGAILVFLAWCGLAGPALAQNREKAWEINPYAGTMSFSQVDGEKVLDNTWDLGFRFGYHITKHHMVEFGFYGASTNNPGLDLTVDLLGGQIDYVHNWFVQHRDKVVLYADAGIGVLNTSSFGFVNDPELVGDSVHSSYNFGGGIRLFGGRRAGFRVDLRRVSFSDNGNEIHFLESTIGMSIVLGGA